MTNVNPLVQNFDKVTVITGAAKGIGAGCARAFVAAGASVVISDLDVSAGEAVAAELAAKPTSDHLFILDEPTTGLHLDDVRKLLVVLNRLVDAGNTVLVVEHHLDVIKTADWVIDLGPEGGEAGGELVAEGTPEQVAQVSGSYTGKFLRDLLPRPNGRAASASK